MLCVAGLCLLIAKKQWADYSWLGYFLAVRCASDIVLTSLHSFGVHSLWGRAVAYHYYFSVYWFSSAIESVLNLLVVYGVFKLAMAPLKGLQALGMLVFKRADGISFAVAIGSAFTPNTQGSYLLAAIQQMQRTQSILTLCLLVFVTFAIRPMGLSYASRIFGVGLGLGIMSANDLVQAAWLTYFPKMSSTAYSGVD